MIPLKLRLQNFMCYRGAATLDLSGIHLACLTGENGHGKSALLDALTYALWGEARTKREDALVTLGADEMQVELEFLLGEEHYRVLRKRFRRGRTWQGALELQLWDGEQFNALSGASMRETQAQITNILRMTYDTFINSAFLLQGRADEFARKAPGERKEILGNILNLSAYDQYEEQAKLRVRELEADSERLEGEIGNIQQELKQKPQHEAELARLERESSQAEAQLQDAEATLQKLRDEKRELDLKARQAGEIEQRIGGAQREARQIEADIAQKRKDIEGYSRRAADSERIGEGFARLQASKNRDQTLNDLLKQSVRLTAERSRLEKEAQTARSQLELAQRSLEERIAACDTQIEEAQERKPDYERFRQTLAQLQEKEAQRDQWREQQIALNTTVNELTVTNKQLRTHMDTLKEKMTALQGAAICPLCRQPISDEEAARLNADYLTEGKQTREKYDANGELIDRHNYQIEQLKAGIQKLDQDLRVKAATQGYEARLSDVMERAERAQAERDTLQEQAAAIRRRLDNREYAAEQHAQLAQIEAQLNALGYDSQAHERIRREVIEAMPFEQEHAQLLAARERLDAERAILRLLEENLDGKRRLIAADEALAAQLQSESARLDAVNRNVAERQRQVNEMQGRAALLNRLLGAKRQLVENARQSEIALAEKQQALKTCQTERALFEELRVAFGKKGVQAMLIERAIPAIEEEANRLLGQMTDGRMSVRFETQREKVSARNDEASAIETLDIVISDEAGARSYELFSGGEAFRVNFAMRIALSKLLARRAGARLQTLVIDEGFGALDTTGRERLVEAINSVQGQFEKILVITHIDELKEMFPVRIDIVKTGGGSSIFVN